VTFVVVDTGVLVAAFNDRETLHRPAARLLSRVDLDFVVPVLCVGEAAYLIARDLGPQLEARFISGCVHLDIRTPEAEDLARMSDIMLKYADFPVGAVDASVVALAERLETGLVATFDRRHFGAVRPRHIESCTLLPEL
jgi:predicted nucleic acid-binding protein